MKGTNNDNQRVMFKRTRHTWSHDTINIIPISFNK